jgi:WD40 repeat protein
MTISALYSIFNLRLGFFSSDDKTFVGGGRDKNLVSEILQYNFDYKSDENSLTMPLWNVTNGKLIQQVNVHQDNVNNVGFTHDCKTIISFGADGKRFFGILLSLLTLNDVKIWYAIFWLLCHYPRY